MHFEGLSNDLIIALICSIGTPFEIEVDEDNLPKAEKNVSEMCEKLLVNLIIEDYKINKL